jgi:Glycogen recognition site of AMP-activated protein kinase
MTDRIDQYVEGTLDRDGLDPSERADADAVVRAISDTRAFIGARPAPDVTAAVMQRVKHGPHDDLVRRAGVVAGLLRLLWTPREISIRPVYAVATAGAVLAVALLVMPRGLDTQTSALRTATATVDPRLFVQFRLQTDAMSVRLAGSFTNWEPAYELHQMAPGVWTITVPLPQGVHDYAFVVDGQRWVADPYAPGINDGFGGTNSRLTLLLPDTARL